MAPNNKHDFVGDDEKEEKKKKNPLSFPRTKRRNNEIRKPINNKRASTRDKNLFSFYCSVACPLSLSHTFDLAGSVARTHTVCGWLNSDESERTQLLRNQFGEDAHTKKDRRPTTLLDNGAISKSSHGNENWSLRTRWSSLFFRFVILYLHIDTTTGYIVYFHWMNGCFELVPLCVCVCAVQRSRVLTVWWCICTREAIEIRFINSRAQWILYPHGKCQKCVWERAWQRVCVCVCHLSLLDTQWISAIRDKAEWSKRYAYTEKR